MPTPNRDMRKYYYRVRWAHPVWGLRAQVLNADPWCVACRKTGLLTQAMVVDHIVPHRGDPVLFWNRENLQGLCLSCHQAHDRRRGLGE